MFRTVAGPRLLAAAACLALLPLATHTAALVAPAELLAVTVALNAAEARVVRRADPGVPDRAVS